MWVFNASRHRASAVPALATAVLVTACAHLERFSGEALEFNAQAADAQNKTLLLNIMRAANRMPMHFTELSTLTGTSTETSTGALTIPFATFRTQTGGALTASPTEQIAHTPTFNVAVLETQEFYQGMMKPVSMEQVSAYLNEGLPPELVLSLSIVALVFQDGPDAAPYTVENNFHPLKQENYTACLEDQHAKTTDMNEYECFRDVLRALLKIGLTTEPVESPSSVGALLFADSFNDLKWLNNPAPNAFKFAGVGVDDCLTKSDLCPEGLDALPANQQSALRSGQQLFRLQKADSENRFCFNHEFEADDPTYWGKPKRSLVTKFLPERIQTMHIGEKLICHHRLTEEAKKIMACEARAAARKPGAPPEKLEPPCKASAQPDLHHQLENSGRSLRFSNIVKGFDSKSNKEIFLLESKLSLQVKPRSTEGIIYYLGEIARCELYGEDRPPCKKTQTPRVGVTYRQCLDPTTNKEVEDVLFKVALHPRDPPESAEQRARLIRVDWAGKPYAVTMDPNACDRSGQVLRVLTQLLALNRAAKDFPAPAVVPIIAR